LAQDGSTDDSRKDDDDDGNSMDSDIVTKYVVKTTPCNKETVEERMILRGMALRKLISICLVLFLLH
jgi:hypothetical protein